MVTHKKSNRPARRKAVAMRDYSKVGPQFWIGPTGKKLRAAGMEAQIVAMYLLTSPHASTLGFYYYPIMFIAHETGMGIEGANKGLQGAIEADFCRYDETSEVVTIQPQKNSPLPKPSPKTSRKALSKASRKTSPKASRKPSLKGVRSSML